MVGLRAKVLGQMGWTTSPYLRAGALSCPSLAIYGPGSYGVPAFILSSAALWETPLGRGLRSCALSALRGTVGGATMTTPGGAGTHWQSSSPRARPTGFSHKAGAPTPPGLRPFALGRVTGRLLGGSIQVKLRSGSASTRSLVCLLSGRAGTPILRRGPSVCLVPIPIRPVG